MYNDKEHIHRKQTPLVETLYFYFYFLFLKFYYWGLWETTHLARFELISLGQTHANGWSRVSGSQNGGSNDYIFPID